jgi:hypothetical protein
MNKENHHIDQLFREKLGNFEKNPPVALFEQINARMVSQQKIRRLNQIRTVIGIAAAMLLILMAGWFTSEQDQLAKNNLPPQAVKSTPLPEQQIDIQKQSENSIDKTVQDNQQKISLLASNHASKAGRKISHTRRNNVSSSVAQSKEDEAKQSVGKELAANDQVKDGVVKHENEDTRRNGLPNNKQQQKREDYYGSSLPAQEKQTNGFSKKGWSLRAELSPMFASLSQSGNSGSSSNTRGQNSISGGMMASYKLSDKLTISSGIRFSQMKQGTHTDYTLNKTSGITYLQPVEKDANLSGDVSLYLPSVSSIVYSNGMQTNSSNVFSTDVAQELKYLEIPIQATYKVYDQKLFVGLTGGISTNFLIGNFASVTENGIKLSQGNTDNIRDVLYSGSAGVEFGYDLGKNFVLTVEPRVKQYLHSLSSNEVVNFKPMQLGIFTGITFSFN